MRWQCAALAVRRRCAGGAPAVPGGALAVRWRCAGGALGCTLLVTVQHVRNLNPTASLSHLVDGLCVIGLSAATACAPCTHKKKRAWHTMSAPPTLTPVIFTPRSRRADLCRPRAAAHERASPPNDGDKVTRAFRTLRKGRDVAAPYWRGPQSPHCPPARRPPSHLTVPRASTCACACSECTCRTASPDTSESSEPIHYRHLPRPQASAAPRTRCAVAAVRAPPRALRAAAARPRRRRERAAEAAGAAGAAAPRRRRRPRCSSRPRAKGRGARRRLVARVAPGQTQPEFVWGM